MPESNIKRGYFVYESETDGGYAVVASSTTHAKQIVAGELDCDWIDIRAKWKRGDVSDLPVGIIEDSSLALRRGFYTWSENDICDICDLSTYVRVEKGVIICGACQNEEMLELHLEVLEMEANNDNP